MEAKQIPEVQYALFCREVVEIPNEETTFKYVFNELFVPHPKNVIFTVVIRLLDVMAGMHSAKLNICIFPSLKLLTIDFKDMNVKARNNLFITQEITIPVLQSGMCIFTVLFDNIPVKKLELPVKIISELPASLA